MEKLTKTPQEQVNSVDRISKSRQDRDAAIRDRGERLKASFGRVIDKISSFELKISESIASSQRKVQETIVKGKEGYESGKEWVIDRFKSGVRYIEAQKDAVINKASEFTLNMVDKIDIAFQKIQLQKEIWIEDRKNFVDSLESKAFQAMQIATSLLKANVERAGDSTVILRTKEALVIHDSVQFAKEKARIRKEVSRLDSSIQELTDRLSTLESSNFTSETIRQAINQLKEKINSLLVKKRELEDKMQEVPSGSSNKSIEQISREIEQFKKLVEAMVVGIEKTRTEVSKRIEERERIITSLKDRAKNAKGLSIDIFGENTNDQI